MLAIEGFGGVLAGDLGGFFVPPNIAALFHGDLVTNALMNDDGFDVFIFLKSFVDVGFERDNAAAAVSAVGGNHGFGLTVFESVDNGVGREASKDDGVNGADAGAGQHRDDRFRGHGHVDHDPVLGLDSFGEENVGEVADFAVKLAIGQGAGFAGFALPNNSGLVGTAIA